MHPEQNPPSLYKPLVWIAAALFLIALVLVPISLWALESMDSLHRAKREMRKLEKAGLVEPPR